MRQSRAKLDRQEARNKRKGRHGVLLPPEEENLTSHELVIAAAIGKIGYELLKRYLKRNHSINFKDTDYVLDMIKNLLDPIA